MPSIKVVFDPKPPLVQEALATLLSRGVDSPLLWGGELLDELVLLEELDNFLEEAPSGEGPHWRSLPFDLEGGMVDRLL